MRSSRGPISSRPRPRLVGRAAAAVSLSDIAAKGGRTARAPPRPPPAPRHDRSAGPGRSSVGAGAEVRRWGADLVGGDTKPAGGRAIVGTVLAEADARRLAPRGPGPGGDLLVTGTGGAGRSRGGAVSNSTARPPPFFGGSCTWSRGSPRGRARSGSPTRCSTPPTGSRSPHGCSPRRAACGRSSTSRRSRATRRSGRSRGPGRPGTGAVLRRRLRAPRRDSPGRVSAAPSPRSRPHGGPGTGRSEGRTGAGSVAPPRSEPAVPLAARRVGPVRGAAREPCLTVAIGGLGSSRATLRGRATEGDSLECSRFGDRGRRLVADAPRSGWRESPQRG